MDSFMDTTSLKAVMNSLVNSSYRHLMKLAKCGCVLILQEVMVKEKLAAIGKPLRKFASTPNLAAAVRAILCL